MNENAFLSPHDVLPFVATLSLGTALIVPIRDGRSGRRATYAKGGAPLDAIFATHAPDDATTSSHSSDDTAFERSRDDRVPRESLDATVPSQSLDATASSDTLDLRPSANSGNIETIERSRDERASFAAALRGALMTSDPNSDETLVDRERHVAEGYGTDGSTAEKKELPTESSADSSVKHCEDETHDGPSARTRGIAGERKRTEDSCGAVAAVNGTHSETAPPIAAITHSRANVFVAPFARLIGRIFASRRAARKITARRDVDRVHAMQPPSANDARASADGHATGSDLALPSLGVFDATAWQPASDDSNASIIMSDRTPENDTMRRASAGAEDIDDTDVPTSAEHLSSTEHAVPTRGTPLPTERIVPPTRRRLQPGSNLPSWTELLEPPQSSVADHERARILEDLIARCDDAAALQCLQRAYGEERQPIRGKIFEALARTPRATSSSAFCVALRIGDEDERAAAVDALIVIGRFDELPYAFADPCDAIAAKAALAFAATRDHATFARRLIPLMDSARFEAVSKLLAGVLA